jgi:hypothetical protein
MVEKREIASVTLKLKSFFFILDAFCPLTYSIRELIYETIINLSGDRIPVVATFFAHVQTGPGVHPDPCTMGTVSFPGVKRPGLRADHPSFSSAEVKKSRAIPLPPIWAFGSITAYLKIYY